MVWNTGMFGPSPLAGYQYGGTPMEEWLATNELDPTAAGELPMNLPFAAFEAQRMTDPRTAAQRYTSAVEAQRAGHAGVLAQAEEAAARSGSRSALPQIQRELGYQRIQDVAKAGRDITNWLQARHDVAGQAMAQAGAADASAVARKNTMDRLIQQQKEMEEKKKLLGYLGAAQMLSGVLGGGGGGGGIFGKLLGGIFGGGAPKPNPNILQKIAGMPGQMLGSILGGPVGMGGSDFGGGAGTLQLSMINSKISQLMGVLNTGEPDEVDQAWAQIEDLIKIKQHMENQAQTESKNILGGLQLASNAAFPLTDYSQLFASTLSPHQPAPSWISALMQANQPVG